MRGHERASQCGSPKLDGAEVAAVLEEAAVARRCWNVLGDVQRCFLVCEEGECGVGRARRGRCRSSGDSPELGKMMARRMLGGSGGLLEFISTFGDVRGSLRRCSLALGRSGSKGIDQPKCVGVRRWVPLLCVSTLYWVVGKSGVFVWSRCLKVVGGRAWRRRC